MDQVSHARHAEAMSSVSPDYERTRLQRESKKGSKKKSLPGECTVHDGGSPSVSPNVELRMNEDVIEAGVPKEFVLAWLVANYEKKEERAHASKVSGKLLPQSPRRARGARSPHVHGLLRRAVRRSKHMGERTRGALPLA